MFINFRYTLTVTLIVHLLTQISYAELEEIESKIAFSSINRDGSTDIFTMSGDVKKEFQLTTNATRDENPTWSPDGKRIAFQSSKIVGNIQIWVIDANGKNLTRLTNGKKDSYPDWSPDGRQIVYQYLPEDEWGNPVHSQRYEIHVIDSNGDNDKKLTEKGALHPNWSPDGNKIAFSFDSAFIMNQIHVMSTDGSVYNQLTHDNGYKRFPTWSPSGDMIAYTSGQRIWLMDSDGMNHRQLTWRDKDDFLIARDEHPTWAPSGGSVAFHSSRGNGTLRIYVVDIATLDLTPMRDVDGISNYQPDWYDPRQLSVDSLGKQITTWGRLKKIASRLQ